MGYDHRSQPATIFAEFVDLYNGESGAVPLFALNFSDNFASSASPGAYAYAYAYAYA